MSVSMSEVRPQTIRHTRAQVVSPWLSFENHGKHRSLNKRKLSFVRGLFLGIEIRRQICQSKSGEGNWRRSQVLDQLVKSGDLEAPEGDVPEALWHQRGPLTKISGRHIAICVSVCGPVWACDVAFLKRLSTRHNRKPRYPKRALLIDNSRAGFGMYHPGVVHRKCCLRLLWRRLRWLGDMARANGGLSQPPFTKSS